MVKHGYIISRKVLFEAAGRHLEIAQVWTTELTWSMHLNNTCIMPTICELKIYFEIISQSKLFLEPYKPPLHIKEATMKGYTFYRIEV